jgi:hypothetical protein
VPAETVDLSTPFTIRALDRARGLGQVLCVQEYVVRGEDAEITDL